MAHGLDVEGLLGRMAEDMDEAVADELLLADIVNGAGEIAFVTLGRRATSADRLARRVGYRLQPPHHVYRDVDRSPPGGEYPAFVQTSSDLVATNVAGLVFRTSDGSPHATHLPTWVEVDATDTTGLTTTRRLHFRQGRIPE